MITERLKGWLQAATGAGTRTAAGTAASETELRVLMVCTGNICRSPTAEAVLRQRLKEAGLAGRVEVDSAGTQGSHSGEAPDARAVKAAAVRGYDLRSLRARPVLAADFSQFHLMLAMDEDHLAWLLRRAPAGSTARIELLMPFARRFADVASVPDPYYGAPAGFERVLDLVEDACEGLLADLRAQVVPAAQDPALGVAAVAAPPRNST